MAMHKKLLERLTVVWAVSLVLAGAGLAEQATPAIRITAIDAARGLIKGTVENLPAAQRSKHVVALYVLTDVWYIHPFASSRCRLKNDNSWESDHVLRGGEKQMAALLVPASASLPHKTNDVEQIKFVAATVVAYKAKFAGRGGQARLVSGRPQVRFAGRTWVVKNWIGGPGPNRFSRSAVAVDGDGKLHLKIFKEANVWHCGEVFVDRPLGYGEYRFRFSGSLKAIDPRIVLGLFVYGDKKHGEIDFELARWGNREAKNAQFVVQPARKKSMFRFDSGDATELTCSFTWRPGRVQFRCWRGLRGPEAGQKPMAEWSYAGKSVPAATEEKVRINLWLTGGRPPAGGQGAEVVIHEFKFIPSEPAAARQIRAWVDAADKVHGFVTGIAPADAGKYGVRVYAYTDRWYIQPYVGSIHRVTQGLTFATWTRKWDRLRADLVERKTDKVVATWTYRRGDSKPARPEG